MILDDRQLLSMIRPVLLNVSKDPKQVDYAEKFFMELFRQDRLAHKPKKPVGKSMPRRMR